VSAVKPTKERASRKKQRQRLIDATISALHLYGPSRTTVDKVVSIAQMSPGIVTFYFDSKAAMLVAALDFLAQEFEEEVMGPVGKLSHDPVRALELLVELYLDSEIASCRKVSVWYAFWGEATSRQEYFDICGRKDAAFAEVVRELIATLVAEQGDKRLDSDAIALGLIGTLEMMWQEFAFQDEAAVDRKGARARAMAYLRSIFPGRFGPPVTGAKLRIVSGGPPARETPLEIQASPRDPAERFAEERDRLFLQDWQFVGHQSLVQRKGEYLTAEIAGERVLVVRDRAGLRAFHNVCRRRPHAVATAPRGRFIGQIECPSDDWTYALDGSLTGPVEALSTPGASAVSLGLAAVEVDTIGGLIFARMGDACPRAEQRKELLDSILAGAGLDHLDEIGTAIEREIQADWKTVVDYMLDGYLARDGDRQSPWLGHPALDAEAPPGALRWRAPIKRVTNGLSWTGARLIALLDAVEPKLLRRERSVERLFLFPNLMIELFPESAALWRITPTAPGRTRLSRLAFGSRAASRELRALNYLTRRQALKRIEIDVATCESTEAGLRSHLSPSPSWRTEDATTARFQSWLDQSLAGQ
jgi:phenylpropionate dioxygenase-like ring-hydroxylating dioxygenase large terminal subunit/AcrR family transcriptional regulator